MPLRAVVFDFDGVIADSEPLHFEGFRRVLATPSSEDRFDFSGRKELYTAYIPWAVAFGVADQWAEKYRIETGEEPPTPVYFGSGYGYTGGNFASSMADDFSSTVSSAISAYQATQSSSSSGGNSPCTRSFSTASA